MKIFFLDKTERRLAKPSIMANFERTHIGERSHPAGAQNQVSFSPFHGASFPGRQARKDHPTPQMGR